jgi:PAS domain S-box-containing protein
MASIPGDPSVAIIRDPLVVSPQATVLDAIAQMRPSPARRSPEKTTAHLSLEPHQPRSNCVVVVNNQRVVGIFTTQDLMGLTLQHYPLAEVTVGEVMTQPVISLQATDFTDLWVATQRLQQHQIRQLPLLNERGELVGLITDESLQQAISHQQLQTAQRARAEAEARFRESEQRYSSLLAAAPVGIFRTDARGHCVYVNERWHQIVGLSPADAWAQGWQQALHPDDRLQVATAWQQAIVNQQSFQLEYRFQHRDGTVRWVKGQAVAEQDPDGRVNGYVGTITDITESKQLEAQHQQAEQALALSAAHQRAIMGAIPDLIVRINRAGIFQEFLASPTFRILGNLSDWVGTHIADQLPPEAAQPRLAAIDQALETRTMQVYEQDLSIEGTIQIEEVRVVPYGEDEVLVLVRDVSDRKRAERALAQSEAQSRAVLATIPDLMFRVGADGRYRGFIGANRALAIIPKDADLVDQYISDVLPPDLAKRQLNALQQALQTGEIQIYEQQVQVGSRCQYEEVRAVKSSEDEVLFMIRDISERNRLEADRKQAEMALAASEAHQRALISALPDLILRVNRTGTYLESVTTADFPVVGGLAELVGTHVSESLPPAAARQRLAVIEQALQTKTTQIYEQDLSTPGNIQVEEVRAVPYRWDEVLLLVRDISERARLEAERQRLEAERTQAENALQNLIAGTAATLGQDFFPALVRHIAKTLKVSYALVTEQVGEELRTLGFWANDALQATYGYGLANTPCEQVLQEGEFYCEGSVQQRFPQDLDLVDMEAEGYLGIALQGSQGDVIGHLCILNQTTIADHQRAVQILRVFAARAAAELERQRATTALEQLNQALEAKVTERTVALQASEAQVRAMIGAIPDLLLRVKSDGTCLESVYPVNSSHRFLPIRNHISEALPPALLQQQLDQIGHAIATNALQVYEHQFKKHNRKVYEEVRITPLGPAEALIIVRDISDRKRLDAERQQVEMALRASEERYRSIYDQTAVGLVNANLSGQFLQVNPRFCEMLGYDHDELIHKTIQDITHPDDLEQIAPDMQRLFAGEIAYFFQEKRYLRKDGSYFWSSTGVSIVRDALGQPVHTLAVIRDISERKRLDAERKRAEMALQAKTEELDRFFALALDLLCIVDGEGRFIRLNHQWEKTLGYPLAEMRDSRYMDYVHPEDVDRTLVANKQLVEDKFLSGFANRYRCRDGSYRWLEWQSVLSHDLSYATARDITVRKQVEAELQAKTDEIQRAYQDLQAAQLQLVQSEKMSSLGQLVAGIAHEINNPVSFIYGNLSIAFNYAQDLRTLLALYQDHYTEPPQAITDFIKAADINYVLEDFLKLLKSMENGAVRIRDIVASLRTFSRLDQSALKATDIHENIDSTLVILQNRLNGRAGKPEIQVVKAYGDLPLIECYSGLLNQVFMNLLVNAIDAVEARQATASPDYAGCITIETQRTADQVRVAVKDNGTGMDAETQAHIFDPFFTTKPVGLGTGMGLSISYQIVTGNHQGQLSCQSVPGEGTAFRLDLWQVLSPAKPAEVSPLGQSS